MTLKRTIEETIACHASTTALKIFQSGGACSKSTSLRPNSALRFHWCAAISLVRCDFIGALRFHWCAASTAPYEPSPGSMISRLPGENPGKRNINQNENRFKVVVQARSLRICDTVVQRRMKRCALRHTGPIPPAPPERPLQSRRLIL
ncbi:hypothetical protein SV7mr_20910 [Stieleria bergensis]|uniref:Uncharacterized protein n=1 Tax=Stieleria bergensis TaxID=2528025 RepID=A0A517STX2_9BACT|nr:hypothetical protein SV7mr_20910 [Planctomycetes bacterium SV_7m_r]